MCFGEPKPGLGVGTTQFFCPQARPGAQSLGSWDEAIQFGWPLAAQSVGWNGGESSFGIMKKCIVCERLFASLP